jgi:transposase
VSEADRVRIIARRERGDTFQAITDEFGINIKTVQAIIAKWNKYHTIQDLDKIGRPPKLDDRTRRHLVRMIENGEASTATQLAQMATTQLNTRVSPRTARRMLHQEGFKALHVIPKPLLSAEHMQKRLEFAQAHTHWTVDNWKQVIFSDETPITAYAENPHKVVWTKHVEGLNPRLIVPAVQGGGPKIMVWGCISKFGFHDLALMEGTVDAEAYITILTNHLLPVVRDYFRGQEFVFQQDGATIHTAYVTRNFLVSKHVRVFDWPPHSPDLNIIEHVWYYLKQEIYKLQPATSKVDLWSKAESVMDIMWSEEMTAKITRLYESMPDRIQAILAANGGNTKY